MDRVEYCAAQETFIRDILYALNTMYNQRR
jgi:hypothetical protein